MEVEEREVAFLSSGKNLNFSTLEKFKFSELLLDDKNATYLSSYTISTLPDRNMLFLKGINQYLTDCQIKWDYFVYSFDFEL